MAEITVKIIITGEEFSLSDVDLDQLTGRNLILQLIGGGVLEPESQLPQSGSDTSTVYALLDKNGVKVRYKDRRNLAEIGFVNGDTIRIIQTVRPIDVDSCAEINIRYVITRENHSISDVNLHVLTGRNLIDLLIDGGVLAPESQLPQVVGIPTFYRLVDKYGALLEPFDPRKLSEIGYSDGDTVRITYRSW